MSDRLTTLERALLAQFEPLATASERALMAEREQRLAQALDEQTKLTEAWRSQSESLVQQVNALLRELRK